MLLAARELHSRQPLTMWLIPQIAHLQLAEAAAHPASVQAQQHRRLHHDAGQVQPWRRLLERRDVTVAPSVEDMSVTPELA